MWAILAAGLLLAIPILAQFVMLRKADFSTTLWGGLAVILLLGVTGTVFGCIQGFGALEAVDPATRTALTMRMLGIALIPTAFSMLVAIPSIIAASIASSLARPVIQPA